MAWFGGDLMELPLSVAVSIVVRSTSKGNPMAELLVDFITSLDGYDSAVGWPATAASSGL